jgi:hypothetical protein
MKTNETRTTGPRGSLINLEGKKEKLEKLEFRRQVTIGGHIAVDL